MFLVHKVCSPLQLSFAVGMEHDKMSILELKQPMVNQPDFLGKNSWHKRYRIKGRAKRQI